SNHRRNQPYHSNNIHTSHHPHHHPHHQPRHQQGKQGREGAAPSHPSKPQETLLKTSLHKLTCHSIRNKNRNRSAKSDRSPAIE
ncbi:MAG: hypothetical protein MK106_15300, partial [Mariniblastus sp.]|nr:hypothetical protein [Mariniblastus sp.]